jgi:hypothetical protein
MDKGERTKGQTTIYKTLHRKTKTRVTRTPLKTGGELMFSGRVNSSCSTSDDRCITAKGRENHLTWKSCWIPACINKNMVVL